MEHPRLSNKWNIRYKFGGAPKVAPPKLPEPVAQRQTLTIEAQKAGQVERRRLIGRRGKVDTRFTAPGFMAPALVERRELKQKFG